MKNEDLYHYINHFGDFSPIGIHIHEDEINQDFIFASSKKTDNSNKINAVDTKVRELNKTKEFYF